MTQTEGVKIMAHNRRAAHNYFLGETFEAGLVLQGSEIKSIRAGHVTLSDAYVEVSRGQATLHNAHIAVYDPASRQNHDPLRPRRLLLHKKQIAELAKQTQQKGFTIVPLKLYLTKGRAKLEIALARGKKLYDKREAIAERDHQRDVERELSRRNR